MVIGNGPPSVIQTYIIKEQILKHSTRNGPPYVFLTFIIIEDRIIKHSISQEMARLQFQNQISRRTLTYSVRNGPPSLVPKSNFKTVCPL